MNIESLPADVLVEVFSNLPLRELVKNVRGASRRWHYIGGDFYLWRVVRIGKNEINLPAFHNAIKEMACSIEEITFELDDYRIRELVLKHNYRFKKLSRLRLLNFDATEPYVDLIAACPSLQHIELRAHEHWRCDRLINAITKFKKLRHLDIFLYKDCHLESLSRCTLAGFPILDTLIIRGVGFPDSVINEIYKGSPMLKKLRLLLKGNYPSIEAFTNMQGHCGCLEEFSLDIGLKLTETDLMFVVGNMPNLRSLSLESYLPFSFTNRSIEFIAKSCNMLESLHIQITYLNVGVVDAFLRYCTHLRKLNVLDALYENVNITYEQFRTLELLKMPRCSFAYDSIILLKQNGANLRVLHLQDSNSITGFAISQIVINCRRLEQLSIYNCKTSISYSKTELDLNFDEFYKKNTPFGRKPLPECNGTCYRRDDNLRPLAQPMGVQNHCCSVDHDTHLERRPISSRLKLISFAGGTRITNRSVIQIAKHCPDLETFFMSKKDIDKDTADVLVKNCQRLKTLHFGDEEHCALFNYHAFLHAM